MRCITSRSTAPPPWVNKDHARCCVAVGALRGARGSLLVTTREIKKCT